MRRRKTAHVRRWKPGLYNEFREIPGYVSSVLRLWPFNWAGWRPVDRCGNVIAMKLSRFQVRLAVLLLLALVALLAFLMFFRSFELRQVYYPDRNVDSAARLAAQPSDDVYFETADGLKLNAWFYPAATNSPRQHLAVVLCHGNGGNIGHRIDVCRALRELGLNVFSFDYRGYGLSEGEPSEKGTYLDAQAAHRWLRDRGFAAENIIAYGESLGGGIASELSLSLPTAGLILQSTFTSIPDIGSELFPWLPVRLLARIRYDTLERLPRIKVPVLVLHSRDDGMIGFTHSERNFAAAKEPKLFAELKGGHNDPLADQDGYIRAMEGFLKLIETRGQVVR